MTDTRRTSHAYEYESRDVHVETKHSVNCFEGKEETFCREHDDRRTSKEMADVDSDDPHHWSREFESEIDSYWDSNSSSYDECSDATEEQANNKNAPFLSDPSWMRKADPMATIPTKCCTADLADPDANAEEEEPPTQDYYAPEVGSKVEEDGEPNRDDYREATTREETACCAEDARDRSDHQSDQGASTSD